MMRYLLISAFVILLSGCASVAGIKRTETATKSNAIVWTDSLRTDSKKNSYFINLKTAKNQISGICVIKKVDNEWRGTFVNEFGAKAFDFVVSEKKCELLNVISMMNKWYIRKTVASDLYFLFSVDKMQNIERFEQENNLVVNYGKKQLVVSSDGKIILLNRAHNITYELHKMIDIDRDKIILNAE